MSSFGGAFWSVVILIGDSQPKADRVTLVFVGRHRVMEAGGQYVRFPDRFRDRATTETSPSPLGTATIWQAG